MRYERRKIRGYLGGKKMGEKVNNKHPDMTTKLQKLVKKRKREVIVVKAGSVKRHARSSGSMENYYPSYAE